MIGRPETKELRVEACRGSASRRTQRTHAAPLALATDAGRRTAAPRTLASIFGDPTYINDTIRREHSPPICASAGCVALAMHLSPC
jgi:hypothetical protein